MKKILVVFSLILLVVSCDFLGGDQPDPFYRGNWQNVEKKSEYLKVTGDVIRFYRIDKNNCASKTYKIEENYNNKNVFSFKNEDTLLEIEEKDVSSLKVNSIENSNKEKTFDVTARKVSEMCEETDSKDKLSNPLN